MMDTSQRLFALTVSVALGTALIAYSAASSVTAGGDVTGGLTDGRDNSTATGSDAEPKAHGLTVRSAAADLIGGMESVLIDAAAIIDAGRNDAGRIDTGSNRAGGSNSAVSNASIGDAPGPGRSPTLMQLLGDVGHTAGPTLAAELGVLIFGTESCCPTVAGDSAIAAVDGRTTIGADTGFDIDRFGVFTAGAYNAFDAAMSGNNAGTDTGPPLVDVSVALPAGAEARETPLFGAGGARDAVSRSVNADRIAVVASPPVTALFGCGLMCIFAGNAWLRRRKTALESVSSGLNRIGVSPGRRR